MLCLPQFLDPIEFLLLLKVQIDENQLLKLLMQFIIRIAGAATGIIQQRLLVKLQAQVLALVIGMRLSILPIAKHGRQHRLANIAQHGLIFIHELPEILLILDQTKLMTTFG